LAGGSLAAVGVNFFKGRLKASGIGLHYFRPLPPIRGAEGTATFDTTHFVADFSSGGVGNLAIKGAHLEITGLDKSQQIIAIEGDADGPVKDALQLLDDPSLGFPRKVGINPTESDGTAQTHLTFRFPAIKVLPFEKMQLTAASQIANGRLGHVFL